MFARPFSFPASLRLPTASVLALLVAACAGASPKDDESNAAPAQLTKETTVTKADPTAQKADQGPSSMVIRVMLKVKADQREAFTNYLREESKTVRKMPGCLRYQLFTSTEADDAFLLYEEWATAEDFQAFQASDTLKKSFAVLGPMLAGPPDSAYFAARKTN